MVSALRAGAEALDYWTTNHISTNYFGLRCVAYGNGRYVAAGGFSDWGVILSSEDGQNWLTRSVGGGPGGNSGLAFVESVIYAGGRFVAVGFWGGTAASTNGIDWTIGNVPAPGLTDGLYGVAYGNGTYVAVGGGASYADQNVFTSSDGISWTAQHSTSPAGASLGDVAYGAGRFVAIGINRGSVNDSGHLYTSTDGTTWTQQSISGGAQVSFCNGRFLIPLAAGTNLISTTGTGWGVQGTGLTNLLGKITYANGSFLARAGSGLAASPDWTHWFQYPQTLPGTSTVATDGQRLVTVGNNTAPFVPMYADGYTYVSDLLPGIRLTTARPPTLALSGLAGRSYRIDCVAALAASGSNSWQAGTPAQLTNSSVLWTDTAAANAPARYYRAVLLPSP